MLIVQNLSHVEKKIKTVLRGIVAKHLPVVGISREDMILINQIHLINICSFVGKLIDTAIISGKPHDTCFGKSPDKTVLILADGSRFTDGYSIDVINIVKLHISRPGCEQGDSEIYDQ
jgi:hypothetical protein